MATVAKTEIYDCHKNSVLVKWEGLSSGDDGDPFSAMGWKLVSLNWTGNPGSPAGVGQLQGSVIDSPSFFEMGSEYNSGGSGLRFLFSPDFFPIYVLHLRPFIQGGTGVSRNLHALFVRV